MAAGGKEQSMIVSFDKNQLHQLKMKDDFIEKLTNKKKRLVRTVNSLAVSLQTATSRFVDMSAITDEYEETISKLMARNVEEKKANKEKEAALVNDMNETLEHLKTAQQANADVQRKHERTTATILKLQENEKTLELEITSLESEVKTEENKYTALRSQIEKKLEQINVQIEQEIIAANEQVELLRTKLKVEEIKITALRQRLQQKDTENKRLIMVIDDLLKDKEAIENNEKQSDPIKLDFS